MVEIEDEIPEEIELPDTFEDNESENPLCAVEDALDAYGRIRREADGIVNFEDFLALKEIILRQSLRLFAPKKFILTEQKIAALREQNEKEYLKLAHVLRLEYQKCLLIITKKACEETTIRPDAFQQTMRHYLEDPDKRDELEQMEKRVKKSVEGKKITQTMDQILKASTFEHKLQRDLTAKLNQLALVKP